ncbi:MAG TPA: sigma factor-like helix-turn-helix DNA-binding protein [Alphaproteobacteria bacterium]|nr:sigma factor-like helix-turn-helix DNA-binding protein [Alphaproteobacteria bacterium]
MQNCLAKLTPAARECIELAYFQGLSYSEVSVRIGRPLGTVKTTIRASLRFMRSCLSKQTKAWARLGN